MKDYIVTEIEFDENKYLAAAFFEDMRLSMLKLAARDDESLIGRIYLGHIDSYADNIGGAFVAFGKDKCFLSKYKKGSCDPGRIPVQIIRDASGKKAAAGTMKLKLSGRYAVLSEGDGSLSFSRKLSSEQKDLLRKWMRDVDRTGYSVLLRTNSAGTEKAEVLREVEELKARWQKLAHDIAHAKAGSLLYRPDPFYIEMLRDLTVKPDRLYSDIPRIAEELESCRPFLQDSDNSNEIYYGNRTLPLRTVYNLTGEVRKLTAKNVWLRSGAYLVIEKTEAFTSVDVNTGKCERGRHASETYRRINHEAAEEVIRQIILRNLSGMILVDFINMENPDHKEELVNVARKLARRDPLRMEVVDLTPLGIMEIIRQKTERPLAEILGITRAVSADRSEP
jgi:ribonuclease G